MTQYNSLNVKLSNLQLTKLESAIKTEIDLVLRLSSNMIGNSDDETNFPHKLFPTNRQVANPHRAFASQTSTDIKLSKMQLSKMIQSGGFLSKPLGPLLKTGLPLMNSVIQPLAKSVLIPLGLTAAASAADSGIHKKIFGSGHNTTLIISNDKMKDILKIVTSLEDSGLFLKGVSETIKDEAKEQKGGFLSMLLGTLGASLLGIILVGKGVIRAGEGTARSSSKRSSFKKNFLIPPHPLKNFEIQTYYQSEPRINEVYSRDNLPKKHSFTEKIKDGAYVINLDEYFDIGTHWVALYINNKTVTYLDSFEVEHIQEEIKNFINNKNIIANIFRIQAYDSIMCPYFCIGFIKFMLKGNSLPHFTNLFSPNNFKKK